MKKFVLGGFLAIGIVLLVLAACTPKTEGTGAAQSGESVSAGLSTVYGSGPIRLILAFGELEPDPRKNYWLRVAMEYANTHPNVSIEVQASTIPEFQKKLDMMAASNTLPDIVANTWPQIRPYVRAGLVSDITDRVKGDPEWLGYFNPHALDLVTEDGRIWGTTVNSELQGWFYNKALFDKYNLKIPETWEEFKNAVVVFRQNGVLPIAHGATDTWSIWGYWGFFYRNGLEEFGAKVNRGEEKWNNPQARKIYGYIKELAELGAYPENVATQSYTRALEIFKAGNAAMICTGSWVLGMGGFLDPEQTPISNDIVFNWGPEFPGSPYNQKVGIKITSWGHFISKNLEKNKDAYEAALDFLKWRNGPEFTRILVEEHLVLPATKYSGDISKLPPLFQTMLKFAGDDYTPKAEIDMVIDTPGFVDPWWTAITAMITNVWTPEEAAQSVDDWLATR
jgi:raffinose/stachyose/melibiose transport system substrate-binding protein